MRWKGREQSRNVEDRRGVGGVKMAGGGILGIVIALALAYFLGVNPQQFLNATGGGGQGLGIGASGGGQAGAGLDDETKEFVSVVLADTEKVWGHLFQQSGKRYREPKLVLYTGGTQTACGLGKAAMGPFYCPGDQQIYLDPVFFNDLARKHKAGGDFAQAYVIAHEVAHHVQYLLGTTQQVERQRRRLSKEQSNQNSVRLELQADYYAGCWAHHAQKAWNTLQEGDIQEALNAATAIGDDRLQKQARGYVVPESFTHGTSKQRYQWFAAGLKYGDPTKLDPFQMDYSDL